MNNSDLWIIVNVKTGKFVRRFGIHGSKLSAQTMLDQYLDSFAIDLRSDFEVQKQKPSNDTT